MTTLMSRPWTEIRRRYTDGASDFAWKEGMLMLVDHLSHTKLHGWTSMFDLCVTPGPALYPYEGPCIRICPVPGTALLELQGPGDGTQLVLAIAAVDAFQPLAMAFPSHHTAGHDL